MTFLSVKGQDPAKVKAFVETWYKATLDGRKAQWLVYATSCVVNASEV